MAPSIASFVSRLSEPHRWAGAPPASVETGRDDRPDGVVAARLSSCGRPAMTMPTPDWSAPIHIRRSKMYDAPALARLAALDSRRLPRGSFLVAEVAGELVAAASLETDEPALGDPFYPTQDLRHFLDLQAGSIRKRQRQVRESSPFARFLHEAKRVLNDAPSASSHERLGSYRTDSTG